VKCLIFFVLIFSFLFGFGQSVQAEYLEAKRQFSLGNYSSAQLSFKSLINDDFFGAYSSFYYALADLKQDNKKEAYDMFLQTLHHYPNWNKIEEVYYWLGYTAFSLNKYHDGFTHIESLSTGLKESLLRSEFSGYTVDELEKTYEIAPDNKLLANYLIKRILSQPYSERDHILLSHLSNKFDIEVMDVEKDLKMIKKNKYAIAAVLPFMYESLAHPQTVIKNSIIFNLYQGMKMAQSDLKKEGILLEIFPIDTKKNKSETQKIVSDGNLENADLIIGPLYRGPNEVISKYSEENKIPMINPLSSNSEITGDNAYSFLFKPSYNTQGRVAAVYSKKKFKENRLAYVFYEKHKDSLVANAYKEEIEKEGFLVVKFERITNESAQQIQKDFIEKYEFRLDTMYTTEQLDSINLLPGRYVKTRPLRDQDSGVIIKDDEGNDVTEYYEERFFIQPDSIGHMFVASGSNLLANNFISLSEVRTDTIGIIGYQNWLEFSTISYDQFERLDIAFISPDLFNKDLSWFEAFKEDFISGYGQEPEEYHLLGYELIFQFGKLLDKYGKYFQVGLRTGKYFKGKVMGGIQYGIFNDNQVVPITKLEELKLVNQIDKQN